MNKRYFLTSSSFLLSTISCLTLIAVTTTAVLFAEGSEIFALVGSAVLVCLGLGTAFCLRYAYVSVNLDENELRFQGFLWKESLSFVRTRRPARVAVILRHAAYVIPMAGAETPLWRRLYYRVLRSFTGSQSDHSVFGVRFMVIYMRNPLTKQTPAF